MHCALWLNKRKINSADEIANDPDIASLRGYFLAGSLVGWLREHGGERYAKKLEKLRPDDPELNEKLAKIFGGTAEGKRFGEGSRTGGAPDETGGVSLSGSMPAALGSMQLSSSGSYSLMTSSFGSGRHAWVSLFGGSFRFGSYFFGSGMHEWEWEWEWLLGLYKSGSFSLGSFTSFHEWEWEWLFETFRSGSFTGSFGIGSFWRFGYPSSFGSLYMPFTNDIAALDEYDRIMLETLLRCPLDRFGYGIHNI